MHSLTDTFSNTSKFSMYCSQLVQWDTQRAKKPPVGALQKNRRQSKLFSKKATSRSSFQKSRQSELFSKKKPPVGALQKGLPVGALFKKAASRSSATSRSYFQKKPPVGALISLISHLVAFSSRTNDTQPQADRQVP